jgi:hypothetical protein
MLALTYLTPTSLAGRTRVHNEPAIHIGSMTLYFWMFSLSVHNCSDV